MRMSCWVSELDKSRIVGPVGYSQMVREGRVYLAVVWLASAVASCGLDGVPGGDARWLRG